MDTRCSKGRPKNPVLRLSLIPALTALLLLSPWEMTSAQVGPKSPTATSNNAGTGSNAWSNVGNILTSNDAYASVGTRGLSNYAVGTGFGFSISSPANILGIQLGVEKKTAAPTDVTLLDNWTSGLTKTISAGTDRCLIVIACIENGTTSPDITAMTYGGRSMTQVTEVNYGGGAAFAARIEVWMLLESQIALAGSTTIVPTYTSYTATEYCETFSAAVFQQVDQLAPVYDSQVCGAIGTANPQQLAAAVNTAPGSMAVNAVTCGNNTTPGITNGGTNTYTINSSYTEGTDIYFANTAVAPSSGACFQTAHKAIATAGTEQPSCTFAGTVNRWAMVGFVLQRSRELDYDVRLVKGGSIVGTNQAVAPAWTTTDGYTTYGGSTNLWGTTWTVADVNAANFGAAISARVQNGTASVDHMQLTIYWQSTLPIDLIDFKATQEGEQVRLDWVTATEHNNDHFIIQRSRDGLVFEDVDVIAGAGNSLNTLFYTTYDQQPWPGLSYYRLRQVDTDGTTSDSPLVAMEFDHDQLIVFPNPTTDGIVTVFDQALAVGQVAIYDQQMRLVRTHYLGTNDVSIHLTDLPDGAYVLMVRSDGGIRTARVTKASGSNY